MKPGMRKLLLALGASMTLAACGGGTDDGFEDNGGSTPGANQPQAVIKASVDGVALATGGGVEVGRTIMLDAGSSAGGVIGYQWILTKVPAGSQAVLANASSAVASFVPDVPGDYRVSLSVGNGAANAASTLDLVAVNNDPVAVVPATVEALVGTVQLDGSGSVPPAGGNKTGLSYAWTLVSVPPASTLRTIPDGEANRSVSRFTADVPGKYEAELVVSYEGRASAPARMVAQVVAPHLRPVANIAPVTTPLVRGQAVKFDGSGSTLGSGDKMQYRWTLTGTPEGMVGTDAAPILENANQAVATFTPRAAGSYALALEVFDGLSRSQGQSQVWLTVVAPENVANTPPVARINLQLYNPSAEGERGAKLQLNGRNSYDIDEPNNMNFVYEWKLLSAPEGFKLDGTDHDLNVRYAYFTPSVEGDYEFEFRVQDAKGAWSAPVRQVYTIMDGANRAPTASAALASGNTNVGVGAVVTLDGSGSSDPDANRLTYAWTLSDRPDGSQAQLSSSTAVRPTFTTDKAGPYTVSLVVTDSQGARSATSTVGVFAKQRNLAPQVRPSMGALQYANQGRVIYDQEQPLLIGKRSIGRVHTAYTPQGQTEYVMDHWNGFALAANASDPDGDPLTYLWALVSEPTGSILGKPDQLCYFGSYWNYLNPKPLDEWWTEQALRRQWDCSTVQIAPTMTGNYEVELLVSDGVDNVGPYRLSLQAATLEDYPSLLLEDVNVLHFWSNDAQALRLQNAKKGYEPEQVLFPFSDVYDPNSYQGNMPSGLGLREEDPFEGDFVLKTMRLTAGARDYTITGLRAYDRDGKEAPKFVGLTDGQVIRKGESVEFQLAWPMTTRPEVCDTSFIVNRDGLVWEFSVAERPGWNFVYNPGNGVKSSVVEYYGDYEYRSCVR